MYAETRQAPIDTPPGVVPNYVNPTGVGGRIVVACPLLAVLASVFVVLRLVVRKVAIKRWSLDDLFVVIALLLAIARATLGVVGVKYFGVGKHIWDIRPEDLVHIGNMSKNLTYTGDMIYFVAIMFTKLAILILYKSIFGVNKRFRWLCYGMMAFVVAYLTAFFFLWAFDCTPIERTWHLIGWQGPGTCLDSVIANTLVGALNIFTDLVILVMPLPLLNRLQLNRKRKIGLMAIFLTGTFVAVCTIVREIIIIEALHDPDRNQSVVDPFVWMSAELCVGIICACLPSLAPLWTRTSVNASPKLDKIRQKLRPARRPQMTMTAKRDSSYWRKWSDGNPILATTATTTTRQNRTQSDPETVIEEHSVSGGLGGDRRGDDDDDDDIEQLTFTNEVLSSLRKSTLGELDEHL